MVYMHIIFIQINTPSKSLYKQSCVMQINLPAISYQTDGERGSESDGWKAQGKKTHHFPAD